MKDTQTAVEGKNETIHRFKCKVWALYSGSGEAIISKSRLSFWGGFDPKTGLVVDRYNDLYQKSIAGKIVVMLSTKGSSGTSGMLALAQRADNAPAGMIHVEIDPMAVLGCLATRTPLVSLSGADPYEVIHDGDWVEINAEKEEVVVTRGE